jgi:hypothetical protein
MNTIIALYLTIQTTVQDRLSDDRGQTSMEWLGIAAVIVAIIVFLVGGPAESMGAVVQSAFERMVNSITGG